MRRLDPNGWPGAIFWTVIFFTVSVIFAVTVPNATVLLMCLLAYAMTKAGVAWLTLRRGGWRRPAGAFIVLYSVAWMAYVGYIVQFLYRQVVLPDHALDVLYALMFTGAAMSVATFPWRISETNHEQGIGADR